MFIKAETGKPSESSGWGQTANLSVGLKGQHCNPHSDHLTRFLIVRLRPESGGAFNSCVSAVDELAACDWVAEISTCLNSNWKSP